jgi:hypothetical protein
MNIFYLDKDPEIAAQYHCDKHCVKMILESAQLLSTAHRVLDGDEDADRLGLYKSFSPNHPSAIWVRQSDQNYNWLWELLHYLGIEYSKRYDKVHSIHSSIRIGLGISPSSIPKNDFTPPPQCMPDQYKVENDPVQGYKNYYHGEKAYFAQWRLGEPAWWKGAA